MSWADLKRKYESGECSATQSTEDMAARRVLRAMGLTEKSFPRAERELGTDLRRTETTTLLERVKAYFSEAHEATSRVWRFPEVRDVRSVKDAEHILMDLVEQSREKANTSLVYRIKQTDDLRVMTYIGGGTIFGCDLTFPCILRKTGEGLVISDCDAWDYFEHITGKDNEDGSAD